MPASPCLPRETLKEYLNGAAEESAISAIEDHLAECQSCEQTIVELEAHPDTLWVTLREQPLNESQEKSESGRSPSVVERAVDAVKALEQPAIAPPGPLEKPSPIRSSQIGAYELLRPLGRGGMGLVMLARHTSLHKEVAIKILPSVIGDRPELERRFQREIVAAGKLNHPSIVNATDAGKEQGTNYLVMEFIDGLDLSRIARLTGPLSIADACEIIRQAALGLSYAHAQGIVHRDIKPSNLMLDKDGRVKILDFGLAQLNLWDETACELTTVGQLMGTLDYMAPEQAERAGPVDHRADLYALGATLFRLLTGRAPLAASPNMTLLEKVRLLGSQSAPRVTTLREDCPAGLSQLASQLLSRQPEDRPPSAAHVAEAVAPFCEGHQLDTLLQRARTAAETQRSDSESTPATGASISLQPSLVTHDDAPPSPPRTRWWLAAAAMFPLLIWAGILITLETQKGQLVIESDVADVQVKIASDGQVAQEMAVHTGAQSTRLRADKYEITIASPSDQLSIDQGRIEVKRGGTVVVRIRKETPIATPEKTANGLAEAQKLLKKPAELTADNLTIAQVLELVSSGLKIPIEVDPVTLKSIGLSLDQKVSFALKNSDVQMVLERAFGMYRVEGEVINNRLLLRIGTRPTQIAADDIVPPFVTPALNQLTYKGQTLAQWLDVIRREREWETQAEALGAVKTLAFKSDAETRKLIVEVLLEAYLAYPAPGSEFDNTSQMWQDSQPIDRPNYRPAEFLETMLDLMENARGFELMTQRLLLRDDATRFLTLTVLNSYRFPTDYDQQLCQWLLEPDHFVLLGDRVWLALVYIETVMGRQPTLAEKLLPTLIERVEQHPQLGLPVVLILQARTIDSGSERAAQALNTEVRRYVENTIAEKALKAIGDQKSSAEVVTLAACRLASTTNLVESRRKELIGTLDQRLSAMADDSKRMLASLTITPGLSERYAYLTSIEQSQWLCICDFDVLGPVQRELHGNANGVLSPPRYFGSETIALLGLVSRLKAMQELDGPLSMLGTRLYEQSRDFNLALRLEEANEYKQLVWPYDQRIKLATTEQKVSPEQMRAYKLYQTFASLAGESPAYESRVEAMLSLFAATLDVQQLDRNGDHKLSPAERPTLGIDLPKVIERDLNVADLANLRLAKNWREATGTPFFLIDLDGNQALDENEWMSLYGPLPFKDADTNDNGLVGIAEMAAYRQRIYFEVKSREETIGDWPRTIIARYDTDGDKQLSLAEWAKVPGSANYADTNRDDRINASELWAFRNARIELWAYREAQILKPGASSAPPATQPAVSPPAPQPTQAIYQGKNLEQWLSIFENDLELKSRQDALVAIRQLVKDASPDSIRSVTQRILTAANDYYRQHPLDIRSVELEFELARSQDEPSFSGRRSLWILNYLVAYPDSLRDHTDSGSSVTGSAPGLLVEYLQTQLASSDDDLAAHWMYSLCRLSDKQFKYLDHNALYQWLIESERFNQLGPKTSQLAKIYLEQHIGGNRALKSHEVDRVFELIRSQPRLGNAAAILFLPRFFNSDSKIEADITLRLDKQKEQLCKSLVLDELASPTDVTLAAGWLYGRASSVSSLRGELTPMLGKRLSALAKEPTRLLATPDILPQHLEGRSLDHLLDTSSWGPNRQRSEANRLINSEPIALLRLVHRLKTVGEIQNELTELYQATGAIAVEILLVTDLSTLQWSSTGPFNPADKDRQGDLRPYIAAAINQAIEQLYQRFRATLPSGSLAQAIAHQKAELTMRKFDADGNKTLSAAERKAEAFPIPGTTTEDWDLNELEKSYATQMKSQAELTLGRAQRMLSAMDDNRDGTVTQDELKQHSARRGLNNDAFMDFDGDDKITAEELSMAIQIP